MAHHDPMGPPSRIDSVCSTCSGMEVHSRFIAHYSCTCVYSQLYVLNCLSLTHNLLNLVSWSNMAHHHPVGTPSRIDLVRRTCNGNASAFTLYCPLFLYSRIFTAVVLPRDKTLYRFVHTFRTRSRLALEASGMAESESTLKTTSRNDLLMFLTEFDRPD